MAFLCGISSKDYGYIIPHRTRITEEVMGANRSIDPEFYLESRTVSCIPGVDDRWHVRTTKKRKICNCPLHLWFRILSSFGDSVSCANYESLMDEPSYKFTFMSLWLHLRIYVFTMGKLTPELFHCPLPQQWKFWAIDAKDKLSAHQLSIIYISC